MKLGVAGVNFGSLVDLLLMLLLCRLNVFLLDIFAVRDQVGATTEQVIHNLVAQALKSRCLICVILIQVFERTGHEVGYKCIFLELHVTVDADRRALPILLFILRCHLFSVDVLVVQ